MHKPQQRFPQWAMALGFFLLVGLLLSWPLATRITSELPGGPHKDGLEDAYQNVWNLWWTAVAMSRPANLLVSDRFFFPESPNLFFHTLSPANTLLAAPITLLWGPIAGFNAVALLSFAIGGLGMWCLARERTGPGPALLAGLVYVASPFHMAALLSDGQLQIFANQWLPWYLLFLLRALREGGRSASLLAALFLVLTAWTDWYYTLFLLICTAGAAVWTLLMPSGGLGVAAQTTHTMPIRGRVLSVASRLLGIGALFALGVAPLLAPMLVEAARYDYMTRYPAGDPARLSADLLAYIVPPRLHSLWGSVPWAWGVGYDVNRRFYLGAVVTLLALFATIRRPAARPWGLVAMSFGLLSLGASLRVNGFDTGIPLPYALLADLPIVRLTRQPDRFNVLVTIALGVLAAHGAAALQGPAWKVGTRQVALLGLLGGLILIDYLPAPIVTRAPQIPPFLAALPHAEDAALLEFPFHDDLPYRDAERMLFQTVHGRPISGGYHSRLYPQPQLGLPALRDLRAGQLASDIVAEPGGWPAALRTIGYGYVIGYKQQPLGPQNLQPDDQAAFRALVEAGLGVRGPLYEDDWLIAYKVPEAAPAAVVQIRSGWGPVEMPSPGLRYRWLANRAELGLFVPVAGRYRLSLSALPAGGQRTLRLELPSGSVVLPLPFGERRYSLLLDLPAGRSLITLESLEPPTTGDALTGNGDTRPISVRVSAIALEAAD